VSAAEKPELRLTLPHRSAPDLRRRQHTAKMQGVRNMKLPSPGLIKGVVQTVVFGGSATYGLANRCDKNSF